MAPALILAILAAAPPAAGFQINSPTIQEVGGNVTMNFGNVVLPNDRPASLVVNAKLEKKEMIFLGEKIAANLYRRLESENRIVTRGEGDARRWEIPDLELLRAPIQEMTRAMESLTLAIDKLQARIDRDDASRAAFVTELRRLRERLDIEEARAQLARERWRSEAAETLGLVMGASPPQGTIDALVTASLQATLDAWKIEALSRWERVVRVYGGLSLGYASLWRERQLVGALPRDSGLGGVREDMATAAALAGVSVRGVSWRAAAQSEIGTRPFTGGGVRWAVGASVARRVAEGRWWLRLGADVAPIDTGAAVEDLRDVPAGQPPVTTTRLAFPLVTFGVGVLAIFP